MITEEAIPVQVTAPITVLGGETMITLTGGPRRRSPTVSASIINSTGAIIIGQSQSESRMIERKRAGEVIGRLMSLREKSVATAARIDTEMRMRRGHRTEEMSTDRGGVERMTRATVVRGMAAATKAGTGVNTDKWAATVGTTAMEARRHLELNG